MIERPQDSDKQIYRSTIEWRATGTPVSDWNSVPRCVPDCALINKGGRHSRPPPLCSVCVSQTSGNFVLSRRAGKNEGEEGIDVVVRVTRCSTSFFFFSFRYFTTNVQRGRRGKLSGRRYLFILILFSLSLKNYNFLFS